MRKILIVLLVLILPFPYLLGQSQNTFRVAWLQSGKQTGFWPVVKVFLQAAAKDLKLNLDIYNYRNNPVELIKVTEQILSDKKLKPHCLLLHNYKKRGEEVITLAEKNKTCVFIFNSGFNEQSSVSLPRKKYKYWIGQMVPDDFLAGYDLAKVLIQKARGLKKNKQNSQIELVGFEGNRTSMASELRKRGLLKRLKEEKSVELKQLFHTKWKEKFATKAFTATYNRYPQVTVFWAASESMVKGILTGASLVNWKQGIDYVTGGVDALPSNRILLRNGKMHATVGGHYAEGAWALVLINDYLRGVDFIDIYPNAMVKTRMHTFTEKDQAVLEKISDLLSGNEISQLNFRNFSRYYNKNLKEYNFDLIELMKK